MCIQSIFSKRDVQIHNFFENMIVFIVGSGFHWYIFDEPLDSEIIY